jgi:alpha-galactosidase
MRSIHPLGARAAALLLGHSVVLALFAAGAAAEVAATPPMGWNSWNHFAEKIDDATVRAQADAMVASGLRDAGYVYVNVDDSWEGERDAAGAIHSNAKFPDMKALADYVHGKGLKFGIYSSPGPKTCAGFEGSFGHELKDAATYAAWGVDYLKYDLCSFEKMMDAAGPAKSRQMMLDAYTTMGNALKATGRPILYSLCQYGEETVWRWGASVGANAWRTTGDIEDSYSKMIQIGFGQAGLAKYAGPGHWNDPDMLEIGNGGMKPREYRTHISLWAMLAAPLLAGNDLTKMTPETVALLTNREIIAIDQDRLGRQGDRVRAEGHLEIWARPLADGSQVIGLFNTFSRPQTVLFDFSEFGFHGKVQVRDIWAAREMGELAGQQSLRVPGHDVILLRVGQAAAAVDGARSQAAPGPWRALFDGTTLDAWRGYGSPALPDGWRIVDGTLAKDGDVGDLVTRESFANFELELEWKIGKGGNSGIFYRGTYEYDHIYWSAPEYQLLDDANAPDGRSRLTAAGAAYALYGAPAGVVKPFGEWNRTRIVVNGAHVEHWLNCQKIAEYEFWSPDWAARVAASKFSRYPHYGLAKQGTIGIQGDHQGTLSLRNIRIRTLP